MFIFALSSFIYAQEAADKTEAKEIEKASTERSVDGEEMAEGEEGNEEDKKSVENIEGTWKAYVFNRKLRDFEGSVGIRKMGDVYIIRGVSKDHKIAWRGSGTFTGDTLEYTYTIIGHNIHGKSVLRLDLPEFEEGELKAIKEAGDEKTTEEDTAKKEESKDEKAEKKIKKIKELTKNKDLNVMTLEGDFKEGYIKKNKPGKEKWVKLRVEPDKKVEKQVEAQMDEEKKAAEKAEQEALVKVKIKDKNDR